MTRRLEIRLPHQYLPVPLTPAHAAAVVPFCRWKPYFWLSPLVVGSMAPDFAYFAFPPPSLRHVGHRPLGLVLFCVPAGLAVLYAFHRFLKRPLVLLLPRPVRAKLWPHCGPFPLLPLRRLAWICTLLVLGAVTHAVWDGFTHEDGWAVLEYPQMKTVVCTVVGHDVHLFGLMQYGCSLLGLGLLAWWSWQWYCRAPAGRAPADSVLFRRARPVVAAAMIVFAASVGIACGLNYAYRLPGPFNLKEFLTATFITGVDAFGLGLLVFVTAVNMRVGNAAREDHLLRDLSGCPGRQEKSK
jgi:hypothetical protein